MWCVRGVLFGALVLLLSSVLLPFSSALDDGFFELSPSTNASNTSFTVVTTPLLQESNIAGEPVTWHHQLTVPAESLVNVHDFLPLDFYTEILGLSAATPDGDVLAETPVFTLPAGITTVDLTYRTTPIHVSQTCSPRRLSDLLPADARVTAGDASLIIGETCQITLTNPTLLAYSPVTLPFEGIIDHIFNTKTGEELDGLTFTFS